MDRTERTAWPVYLSHLTALDFFFGIMRIVVPQQKAALLSNLKKRIVQVCSGLPLSDVLFQCFSWFFLNNSKRVVHFSRSRLSWSGDIFKASVFEQTEHFLIYKFKAVMLSFSHKGVRSHYTCTSCSRAATACKSTHKWKPVCADSSFQRKLHEFGQVWTKSQSASRST